MNSTKKQTTMMMCGKAQQGSAGVLFIMFLPLMLLSVGFVIYTSQQFLTHTRTLEAVEVAGIAVVSDTKNESLTINDYLHRLINRYVDDTYSIELDIKAYDCSYANGCAINNKDGASKGVTINASTWHESWLAFLPSTDSTSAIFTPPFKVSSAVTTARYVAPPVDLYFIVDFSGSMDNHWGYIDGERYERLELVRKTIKETLDYIESTQDPDAPTRVSLTPYGEYVYDIIDGQSYRVSHGYSGTDEEFAEETIGMMWIHPSEWHKHPHLTNNERDRKIYFKERSYRYHNISPTTDYAAFLAEYDTFRDGDSTNSFQGIISAAQTADKATQNADETNPNQIFILISDGKDQDEEISYELSATHKMCEKIADKIGGRDHRFTTLTKTKTEVTMAIIALEDDVMEEGAGMPECFGDNIFLVEESTNDLYQHIFSLIDETSGRFVE